METLMFFTGCFLVAGACFDSEECILVLYRRTFYVDLRDAWFV